MKLRAAFALAGSIAVLVGGCFEDLDTTRVDQPGTFGHIVLDVSCQRVAYLADLNDGGKVDVRNDRYRAMCKELDPIPAAPPDAPPALQALQAARPELTPALDAVFPEEFLPELQGYLASNDFLATYDDDTGIRAVESLIGVLRLVGEDDEAIAALGRLNLRLGYRPLKPALGAIRAVVNYPQLHDMLLAVTEAITPGGTARAEWENLIAAVGVTLRDAEPAAQPNAPDRVGRLALDLLLTERAMLGTNRPIELVKRDNRGVATVADVEGPFVDGNNDGLADTDERGQLTCPTCPMGKDNKAVPPSPFALAAGVEDAEWPFRDDEGHPVKEAGGDLLYQYVDLDKTVLSALARDGVQLFDPAKGTALNLLRGSSALMGAREEVTKTFASGESIQFRGYKGRCVPDATATPSEAFSCGAGQRFVPEESALLDMLYGYLQVLRAPNIGDVLDLGKKLLTDDAKETAVARMAEQVIIAARKADLHPEANIAADKALWDDLMPIIQQIAAKDRGFDTDSNPATNSLVVDLLKATEDPEVKKLGDRFAKHMLNKDTFAFDRSRRYAGGTRELDLAVPDRFVTPVDRSQPDSGNNRSIMQRLLHLIAESNGATMCNIEGAQVNIPNTSIPIARYHQCDLVNIRNLAVLYVQSIAYAKNASGQVICEREKGAFDDNVATAPDGRSCPSGTRPRPKADLGYDWGNVIFPSIPPEGAIGLLGGDKLIEDQGQITGFRTHPTPFALNRVLALDDGDDCPVKMPDFLTHVVTAARDKDGDKFCTEHPDILQVWELEGFYDQIRPIVQAFADHGAEQLFVDMLTVLNKHWASNRSLDHQYRDPNGRDYATGAALNTYEPLIADMLAGGGLLGAIVDGSRVINTTRTDSGRLAPAVLAEAMRFVITPLSGLANRLGSTTSKTADGRMITTMSPWHLLADAYALKKVRLAAGGGEGDAWTSSVSQVIDVLTRGVEIPGQGGGSTWKFKNPRMRGVSVALIDFLQSRLAAYPAGPARDAWLSKKLPGDLNSALTSPVFAGAADFVLSLSVTPETRSHLESMVRYLVDEVAHDEAFTASLTSMADMLQLALSDADIVPLAHVAGEALRPERGWVENQLTFFKRAAQADKDDTLSTMLRNLYAEHQAGRTAIGDLIDGIAEVHRANPYTQYDHPYTEQDFRALMSGLADFLDDEKRGLRKFIAIIKNRNVPRPTP